MNQKGFTNALIVLVIVLFGIGGYYLYSSQTTRTPIAGKNSSDSNVDQQTSDHNQQTDGTVNWKTYHNEKFSFEFQYSSSWFILDTGGEINLSDYDINDPRYERGNPNGTKIQFVPSATTRKQFPQVITNENIGGAQDQFSKTSDNGLSIVYKINNPIDGNCYYLVFSKNSNQHVCVFAWFKRSNIDQIVSTFKFTAETSGWKTYKDETYRFEFSYPREWNIRPLQVKNESKLRIELTTLNGVPTNLISKGFPPSNPELNIYMAKDFRFGGGHAGGYSYRYNSSKDIFEVVDDTNRVQREVSWDEITKNMPVIRTKDNLRVLTIVAVPIPECLGPRHIILPFNSQDKNFVVTFSFGFCSSDSNFGDDYKKLKTYSDQYSETLRRVIDTFSFES